MHGSQVVAYKNGSSKTTTFLKKPYIYFNFSPRYTAEDNNALKKNHNFSVPTCIIRQLLVGVGFEMSNFLFVHSTLMYNVHS